MRRTGALLIAALLGVTPSAMGAGPSRVGELGEVVSEFKDAVASPFTADTAVHLRAYELFNRAVPSTAIAVRASLSPWRIELAPQDAPSDIERMRTGGRKMLLDSGQVPPPELSEVLAYDDLIVGMDGVKIARMEREERMGEYAYKGREIGTIKISDWLPLIAMILGEKGDALAYATEIHEAGHLRDQQNGRLSPEEVVQGEIQTVRFAVLPYLKMIAPDGVVLGTLRIALQRALLRHPKSPVIAMALSYVTSLDVLFGTQGDEAKIRKYVEDLGYREGHDHDGERHPAPGAPSSPYARPGPSGSALDPAPASA